MEMDKFEMDLYIESDLNFQIPTFYAWFPRKCAVNTALLSHLLPVLPTWEGAHHVHLAEIRGVLPCHPHPARGLGHIQGLCHSTCLLEVSNSSIYLNHMHVSHVQYSCKKGRLMHEVKDNILCGLISQAI